MRSLKICSLVLVLCLLLAAAAVPAAAAEGMDPMRAALMEQGVPEDFISRRTDAEIEELYGLSQTETVGFGGVKTAYYVDSGAIGPGGETPSPDMVLDTAVFYTQDSSSRGITAAQVYLYYDWAAGHPLVRKEDVVSVNWDPDVWVYGGDFHHVDRASFDGISAVYSTIANPAVLVQGGLVYYCNLARDTEGAEKIPSGRTCFKLTPKYPGTYYSTTEFVSSINANYAHDKEPLPFPTSVLVIILTASALLWVLFRRKSRRIIVRTGHG